VAVALVRLVVQVAVVHRVLVGQVQTLYQLGLLQLQLAFQDFMQVVAVVVAVTETLLVLAVQAAAVLVVQVW
jgi:hypothetical protein